MYRKNLLSISFAVLFIFGVAGQAFAAVTTVNIDLLSLFDTNSDGILEFGDDGSPEFNEKKSISSSFMLTQIPNYDYNATVTVTYEGYDPSSIDSDAHISIAGVSLGDFSDTENNTQSWAVDINNFVPYINNSITIYTAYYTSWLYDHWENFQITSLALSYSTGSADPVPVPDTGLLLGLGLAMTGFIRRK